MKGSLVLLLCSVASASPLLAERGHDHGHDSCPSTSCNVKGFPDRYHKPYKVLKDPKWCSPKACGEHCASYEKCKAFAASKGECRLYNEVISKIMWTSSRTPGPFEFSSKCCSEPGDHAHHPGKPPQEPTPPSSSSSPNAVPNSSSKVVSSSTAVPSSSSAVSSSSSTLASTSSGSSSSPSSSSSTFTPTPTPSSSSSSSPSPTPTTSSSIPPS